MTVVLKLPTPFHALVFAAKAGAKHVYAIEASGLAHKARRNIAQNGYENVITVLQGKVEEIELPVKQVDVIVSEWMVSIVGCVAASCELG